MSKRILDVACGSKKFWFDKQNNDVQFCDIRKENIRLCDGRIIEINPDTVCDFRKLPFKDNSYYLVVFDPPHIKNIGENAFMALTYGKLNKETWKEDIKKRF